MARRRRQAMVRAMVVAACVALATACGAAQEVGDRGQQVASEDAAAAATPHADRDAASPPPSDAETPDVDDLANAEDDDRPVERSLRPVVDEAVRDLAARAGVPPDQVRVVLAQRVMWPDDALGCPLPGGGEERGGEPRQGTRVHLEVGDRLYRYHTGGAREEPFLCDPAAAKLQEYHDRIEP
jgi:hypothetical protein